MRLLKYRWWSHGWLVTSQFIAFGFLLRYAYARLRETAAYVHLRDPMPVVNLPKREILGRSFV